MDLAYIHNQVSVLWAPHCGGKQKWFNYDLIENMPEHFETEYNS